MSQFLKQSTAATIMFGPFVDKTDGVTLEVGAGIITSIDHATTGIFLSKAGGTGAIRHQTVTASVLDAYGMFKVTLDTTDTGTVGTLDVLMAEAATFLPVHKTFMVLPANVYDSLMGTDLLDISVVQIGGVAQSATDLKDLADTGYDPSTHKVQGVVLSDTVTTLTGHTAQTGDNYAQIGTAGASLTDLGGMSTTMKGQVNTEADTALSDIHLDHLIQVASTVSDAAAAAGDFDTALAEITNDHYNDMVIVFTAGVLAGQARRISDYDGTSKNIIVLPAFTEAPANSDPFVIISGAYLQVIAERLDTQAKADVNAEADTALTDYDPPTKAEMDTGHGLLATPTQVNTEVDNALNTAIPASPVAGSVNERVKATDDKLPTNYIMGSSVQTDKDDEIDDILADTAEIGTAGAGLTDLGGMSTTMKGQIDTEVDEALATTTYAEPSGIIAATSSLKDKICWLFTLARNKITQTATTQTLRNDADDGSIATSTVEDDGTTATRNEFS